MIISILIPVDTPSYMYIQIYIHISYPYAYHFIPPFFHTIYFYLLERIFNYIFFSYKFSIYFHLFIFHPSTLLQTLIASFHPTTTSYSLNHIFIYAPSHLARFTPIITLFTPLTSPYSQNHIFIYPPFHLATLTDIYTSDTGYDLRYRLRSPPPFSTRKLKEF